MKTNIIINKADQPEAIFFSNITVGGFFVLDGDLYIKIGIDEAYNIKAAYSTIPNQGDYVLSCSQVTIDYKLNVQNL